MLETKITLNSIYKPSEDVVAREVQGELIIIPITSGVGDLEDGIFTLNETGRAIWDKLDSKKSLKGIIDCLSSQFTISVVEIEKDVLSLAEELSKKKIVVEA